MNSNLTGARALVANQIEIDPPAAFDAGAIYQFRYEARDPRPFGLSMAAVRDVVTFFTLIGSRIAGHAGGALREP